MVKVMYFIWAMLNVLFGLLTFAFISADIELVFETGNLKFLIIIPVLLLSLKGVHSNILSVKSAMEIIHNIEDGIF